MIELMKLSSIDFTAEHMMYKLYKYGFSYDLNCSKWMNELCNNGELIFNGWKSEKVDGRLVGYEPVFGLITQKVDGEITMVKPDLDGWYYVTFDCDVPLEGYAKSFDDWCEFKGGRWLNDDYQDYDVVKVIKPESDEIIEEFI